MVRDYELMYIVRPDVDDDGLQQAMNDVQGIIENQGGEVIATTSWGKRRLAYEIDRLRDGHYVILQVRIDAAKVREIERLLAISDSVFRHMVTLFVARPEGEDGGEPRETRGPRRDETRAAAGEEGDAGVEGADQPGSPEPTGEPVPVAPGGGPDPDDDEDSEPAGTDGEEEA